MSQQNKVENAWHGDNKFITPEAILDMQKLGNLPITSPNEPEGGIKHDKGKPDFTYLSYEFLEQVALVRDFGSKKYSRSNWKKGFKVTRSLAACLRHIFSFLRGEDNDRESGLSHLAHAACCLEHAIYDMIHHPENDDREKQ